MPRAVSRYRQVRVTITEEAGGHVTVRVMAKPVNADWSFRDTVWHHRWTPPVRTTHWSELVREALSEVLTQRVFPSD